MRIHKQRATVAAIAILFFFECIHQSSAQQQFPVNVSPAQLTFNSTASGPATPSQILNVSSTTGSNTTFRATALSGGNWLSVSPQSGTTPQALSVSVNPAGLTAGSYAGFITVTAATGAVTVPVILNVNLFGAPPFVATPSALFFGILPGSTTTQVQQINLSGATNAPTSFTATASTSNGGNFLTVNPSSGSTPGTLTVSVNPTNLSNGFFFGAIAINPPNTTGLIIPVQVNVGVQSAINIRPQQLAFAHQMGTSAPAAQTLFLTTTETPVGFTASVNTSACSGNWVSVSPSSGVAPGTITVQVDPTGLPPTTCNGVIYISAPGAANPNITIPVSLLVSKDPVLQVPAILPAMQFQTGTTAPVPQSIQVTSSSTPLNFTVTATPAIGSPDFLTVSPTSGTTPQTVTFSVNPAALAGLAPNTYYENVTFSAVGSAVPNQTITVQLNVSSSAVLMASQQSLNFNFQTGQTFPQNQIITVASTGAPLPFSVFPSSTNCSGFLSATTSAGSTPVQTGQQAQIVVSVDPSGIKAPQTCFGNVLILVPGSTAPGINIPVTLNVGSIPTLIASPASINVSAIAGSPAIQQSISLTSTDNSTALNFSATASTTNPAFASWLSVSGGAGSSPATITVTLDPSALSPGVYTGAVTISSTSSNVAAQTIPVVLTVTSGPVTASSSSLTFTQPANGPAPTSQTVQITGIPTGTTLSAVGTVLTGSNWLTVTASGGAVTVSVNGASLPKGTYSGVVTIVTAGAANNPLNIPVTLNVT